MLSITKYIQWWYHIILLEYNCKIHFQHYFLIRKTQIHCLDLIHFLNCQKNVHRSGDKFWNLIFAFFKSCWNYSSFFNISRHIRLFCEKYKCSDLVYCICNIFELIWVWHVDYFSCRKYLGAEDCFRWELPFTP